MSGITFGMLSKALPRANSNLLMMYAPLLNHYADIYKVSSPLRIAHSLGQFAHESAMFSKLKENLNYSAEGLVATWPNRFNRSTAATYARKPMLIANLVYANRMGNGDVNSGDGGKYIGRGLIHTTGKSNYMACGTALGLDLVNKPELLEDPKNAVNSAYWFWTANGLNKHADKDDILTITRRINGGENGLQDRIKYVNAFKQALGIATNA